MCPADVVDLLFRPQQHAQRDAGFAANHHRRQHGVEQHNWRKDRENLSMRGKHRSAERSADNENVPAASQNAGRTLICGAFRPENVKKPARNAAKRAFFTPTGAPKEPKNEENQRKKRKSREESLRVSRMEAHAHGY